MGLSDDEIILMNCYNFAVMRFEVGGFLWFITGSTEGCMR